LQTTQREGVARIHWDQTGGSQALPAGLRVGENPDHVVKIDHGGARGRVAQAIGQTVFVHFIKEAIERRRVTLAGQLELCSHPKVQVAVAERCVHRVTPRQKRAELEMGGVKAERPGLGKERERPIHVLQHGDSILGRPSNKIFGACGGRPRRERSQHVKSLVRG